MRILTSAGESQLRLHKAILVYQSRGARLGHNDGGEAFATIHSVSIDERGASTINPGSLLKREALEEALGALAAGAGSKRYRFVDDSVLASGPGMTAWFTASQARHMSFAQDGVIDSGVVAQPAMLWLAVPGELYVFALASDERPGPGASVFHAPHFNVWKGGRLCRGTAKAPSGLDPQAWMTMFYQSSFTHPNDGNRWQTSHRGGATALWKKLLREGGKKPFPVKALAPTGATVEQIIDSVMTTGIRGRGQ